MVITKTPLRLSICGGGTDLPSYYQNYGSMFISAAINKYIYITYHRSGFSDKIRCRYSAMEEVDTLDEIKNEILRESLKTHNINNNLEITSHAEIPSGTGLGSSGSFGVGVLNAIYAERDLEPLEEDLAEEATKIQTDILKLPIGKQDQYVAAFGGVNIYQINQDGKVEIEPLKCNLKELQKKLVLFFTGYNRQSDQLLSIQKVKTESGNKSMIEALHKTQELGWDIKKVLEEGSFDKFGEIMNYHWEVKKQRGIGMTNSQIDHWYKKALKNGAIGGKLVGAGGGGFLLFYTNDREKLVKSMGLKHLPFKFEMKGSKQILND